VAAIRRTAGLAAAALGVAAVAGCGFLAASDKPLTKPNSFVLFGHADVALPADDHRAAGTACTTPDAGVGVTTSVTVTDAGGAKIAHGSLGAGVIVHIGSTATCNFPFRIYGVPGGGTTYGVAVGDQAPVSFPGSDLTRNRAAVITVPA
jgi:hypothetical protein